MSSSISESDNPTTNHGDSQESCSLEIGVHRSGHSDHKVWVRFVNVTNRTVDIVWLDFNGRRVPKETLEPRSAR